MNTLAYFKDKFENSALLNGHEALSTLRKRAFDEFVHTGIPTSKHEEWKYTRIASAFNKEYNFPADGKTLAVTLADIDAVRLPGHEEANELVFINGIFTPALSSIRSAELEVLPLEKAVDDAGYAAVIDQHLGDSSHYLKDGINALNTAFLQGAVFIQVKKGKTTEHPVYVYNITDSRAENILSQPRSLVHVSERGQLQWVETFITLGSAESFTNQVAEFIIEQDAVLEFYKIQNEAAHVNMVSTTHIRQVAKSLVHTVTISLNGAIIRNNLNIVMDAEHCESHMYGLYLQKDKCHVDNHTVVDNAKPHCFSNELYKGIVDDEATAVFNGKIFVQKDAQKINAYQSNKNVLLSDTAVVNAKPQLEIFADDVKCSHGCTVGMLDEAGLFYLRSRGINEDIARSLLLHAYVVDILDHIKIDAIRSHVDELISERLEYDLTW